MTTENITENATENATGQHAATDHVEPDTAAGHPVPDASGERGADRQDSEPSVSDSDSGERTDRQQTVGAPQPAPTHATGQTQEGAKEPGGGADAPWLVPAERAQSYRGRWNQLKGEFVDDPRHAVRQIDELVGEVLDEIDQTFRRQRSELGSGMGDKASTEDLRVAFGRYREFFERLLSV